jgi:hypothetical protein
LISAEFFSLRRIRPIKPRSRRTEVFLSNLLA